LLILRVVLWLLLSLLLLLPAADTLATGGHGTTVTGLLN
jgi:hypothetical protein